MAERIPPPTPELPPAAHELDPSPLWPQHLVDLYFRPSAFFKKQLALGETPYVIFVTWILGMSAVIDRISSQIAEAELTGNTHRLQAMESILNTWPLFWALVIGMGAISGVLHWWVAGWWCKIRLRWCGAPAPDPRHARLLLIYSSFISAGPYVLSTIAQTFLYPSYMVAYEQEIAFSLIVMVTVFWSMATTYKGALALFQVRRGLAKFWFIVLPAVFYFVLLGGLAFLFAAAA